jgi:GNAT superfamily N-acetyltransferase
VPMTIQIRLATAQDIPNLKELIPISVRALSTSYYSDPQIESAITHIFGVDSQLVADGTYYAAVAGEQIVGCGGWSKRKTLYGGDQMKSAEDNLLDPTHEPARIRAFFVHPQWARQGIGKQIIQLCEEAARSDGFQSMELLATLPGEPLYAALGYEVTKRLDVAMPDGEVLPTAHMVKSLR